MCCECPTRSSPSLTCSNMSEARHTRVPRCATARSRSRLLSVFAELLDAVVEVLPTLREQGIAVYLLSEASGTPGVRSLSDQIAKASDRPLSRDLRANVHIRSTALYIYTSGTTGNARVHGRCQEITLITFQTDR